MKIIVLSACLFLSNICFCQLDTLFISKLKSLDTANTLRLDTMPPPNDQLTKKIKQLRNERSGLTTEMAIQIKLMEEEGKDTSLSKEFYNQLKQEATSGKTSRLIDNCLINLYRRTFTEKEIDDLIRFYKTSAGKKMDKEFILLMIQSIKDAEYLLKIAAGNLQNKKDK